MTNLSHLHSAAVAREYLGRLMDVLGDRFGVHSGDPLARAAAAARYLPESLAARLMRFARVLDECGKGRCKIRSPDAFRASAEALLAALHGRGVSRTQRAAERSVRALFALGHTLLILSPIAVVLLSASGALNLGTLGYIAYGWAWGAYVYWLIDRTIVRRLRPTWVRGLLRVVAAAPFAIGSPAALALAVINARRAASTGNYVADISYSDEPDVYERFEIMDPGYVAYGGHRFYKIFQ